MPTYDYHHDDDDHYNFYFYLVEEALQSALLVTCARDLRARQAGGFGTTPARPQAR